MSDLLKTLGTKTNSAEGAGKASEPQPPIATNVPSLDMFDRGDNLIAKASGKEPSAKAAAEPKASSAESGLNPKTTSSKEEPTGKQVIEDWDTASALNEVKKLRQENKSYRIKYQEQIEKLTAEADARLEQQKKETESLLAAKEELDRIKADQEDKKRDLTEKIAHREARLAEMQAKLQHTESQFQKKVTDMEKKLQSFEAERAAEAQIYQSRVEEELAKIPERYKDYAKLLVKGAQDSREALVAISEARLSGLFEDKTVIVNHSVPGANDGARTTSERMEQADRERRDKMNSSQKIAESLRSIKSGNPNSAFRIK